ncbi:N-formylglutamate amidohydrolase [Pseudooceanicola nitratireducens]|uniref:N-formylglutamate amidohydrolase n=1 Tax=Pseudooceanicola nitratireducens TaxID=517719 RepID=UPI003519521B
MTNAAFDLFLPEILTTSVVFASPHSGRDYSDSFLNASILDRRTIRSSEDAFVGELFASAPDHGAPLLVARAPRAYVDLNRSPDELDPAVVDGLSRVSHNPRVASGLGVIPRVVANGRAIYRGKLPLAEARQRLEDSWHPYHDCLADLLAGARRSFGEAILIDCHSMPREAVTCISRSGARRPDVVLGDRFGASAAPAVTERIEEILKGAGLTVARNTPFAGAFVTQHYGRPLRGQHAVQLEIDRSLYMDEARIEPRADFAEFQALIAGVAAELAEIGRAARPLVAE